MLEEQKKQLKVFQSKEELLAGAETQVSLAPSEFKVSIKLYYIARYFVAIYESRYQEIPIQVWNEYRNALDHLFRHLTAGGKIGSPDDASKHLKKMEGHIQRAALDILKIFSHKSHESISSLKASHDPKILRLVDNGKFLQSLNKKFQQAQNLFELAKVNDLDLGDDSNKNADVLERYLDAAFAYDQLRYWIIGKDQDIYHAYDQYDQIHSRAHTHSFFENITMNFIVSLIIALAGVASIKTYWPEIEKKSSELIDYVTTKDEIISGELSVKEGVNAK